jgi:cytoskeletal protein RodZ
MSSPKFLSRIMIAAVAFVLCGGPALLQAQQAIPPSTTQQQQDNTTPAPATSDQAAPEPAPQDQNVGTTPQNATPDPSKGPLQPAETNTLPNAPSVSQPTAQPQPQPQPAQAPAGAAAAQGIKTAGGAASRPAGTAIAPAKQHQSRSLFIKIGAIAAGAAALGAVYGLSRSSPSLPPGARTSTIPATGH